jgi:hypothetical protein
MLTDGIGRRTKSPMHTMKLTMTTKPILGESREEISQLWVNSYRLAAIHMTVPRLLELLEMLGWQLTRSHALYIQNARLASYYFQERKEM